MIRALLIERAKNKELIYKEIELKDKDHLKQFYYYLNCDCIDIQERYINGKIYDFIIDDEYMLNGKAEPNKLIAVGIRNGEILEVIYGSLIICGIANDKGEETSLNQEDIYKIASTQIILTNTQDNTKINALNYAFEDEENKPN